MARYTVQEAARTARHFPGMEVRAVIDAGGGAGFMLSVRPGHPGVLGLGAVDLLGESAAVGLNRDEAAALRDALTDWLGEE